MLFSTDYNEVLQKIDKVNPSQYAKTRNFINGAVTYLSPYISRGVISVRQVLAAMLAKGIKPYAMEKFVQELAWREYYQRVWQAKGNAIWSDLKQEQHDVRYQQMPKALLAANTGIDAIDGGISTLYETGYMHNHIRMYVASIACNIARTHWAQPASWLYYHLLDGDMASNNCSWQWVAGAFSSKKYYCNQENINKYTSSNQQRGFLASSYEEIETMEMPEVFGDRAEAGYTTQLPAVKSVQLNTALPTLLYTAYNLDPQWRSGDVANRILLLEPSHYKEYPVSEKVIQFIIDLSANIKDLQVHVGELTDLEKIYATDARQAEFIAKEHPLFQYSGVTLDSRDWMFPEVAGYHPSFFGFWKKCEKYFRKME
jgi:deoxyribodipyrimidine photo-lyase